MHGASTSPKALSIVTANLDWITLRGRVAPGNRTTPAKRKCIEPLLFRNSRKILFLHYGCNLLMHSPTWVKVKEWWNVSHLQRTGFASKMKCFFFLSQSLYSVSIPGSTWLENNCWTHTSFWTSLGTTQKHVDFCTVVFALWIKLWHANNITEQDKFLHTH